MNEPEKPKGQKAPKGPCVRHAVRCTERDQQGREVKPPPGMIRVRERFFEEGQGFAMAGGGLYQVKSGTLRRVDKRKGESKKERRMRRATVKAVRASREQG